MTFLQSNGENSSATNNSTSNSNLPFSCKQTLYRSIAKVKSPNEKAEVMQRPATKYKLRIDLKENRGRRNKEINEDEKIWLIEFLKRSYITYTSRGRKDHVCIGKFNGERKYK